MADVHSQIQVTFRTIEIDNDKCTLIVVRCCMGYMTQSWNDHTRMLHYNHTHPHRRTVHFENSSADFTALSIRCVKSGFLRLGPPQSHIVLSTLLQVMDKPDVCMWRFPSSLNELATSFDPYPPPGIRQSVVATLTVGLLRTSQYYVCLMRVISCNDFVCENTYQRGQDNSTYTCNLHFITQYPKGVWQYDSSGFGVWKNVSHFPLISKLPRLLNRDRSFTDFGTIHPSLS